MLNFEALDLDSDYDELIQTAVLPEPNIVAAVEINSNSRNFQFYGLNFFNKDN